MNRCKKCGLEYSPGNHVCPAEYEPGKFESEFARGFHYGKKCQRERYRALAKLAEHELKLALWLVSAALAISIVSIVVGFMLIGVKPMAGCSIVVIASIVWPVMKYVGGVGEDEDGIEEDQEGCA